MQALSNSPQWVLADPSDDGDAGRLAALFLEADHFRPFVDDWGKLALSDVCLGAGSLSQTHWNRLTGQPLDAHIRDFDIAYFDPDDLSAETEHRHERRLEEAFPGAVFPLDVKNQARVHLWYEKRFGYPLNPLLSIEAAISTWPTTATAVALRRGDDGRIEIFAPYGLGDLLAGIVRPNKIQIKKMVYERKVARWRRCWPELIYIDWDEAETTNS